MKMLVFNKFGNGVIKESDIIPRVGDMLDLFYLPLPTVTEVVLWPTEERLKEFDADKLNIQAIIRCE